MQINIKQERHCGRLYFYPECAYAQLLAAACGGKTIRPEVVEKAKQIGFVVNISNACDINNP